MVALVAACPLQGSAPTALFGMRAVVGAGVRVESKPAIGTCIPVQRRIAFEVVVGIAIEGAGIVRAVIEQAGQARLFVEPVAGVQVDHVEFVAGLVRPRENAFALTVHHGFGQ